MDTASHFVIGNAYRVKNQPNCQACTLVDVDPSNNSGVFIYVKADHTYTRLELKLEAMEPCESVPSVYPSLYNVINELTAERDEMLSKNNALHLDINSLTRINVLQAERANATIDRYQKEVETLRNQIEDLTARITERESVIVAWQRQNQSNEDKIRDLELKLTNVEPDPVETFILDASAP